LKDFQAALLLTLVFFKVNLSIYIKKYNAITYISIYTLYLLYLIILYRKYIPFIPLRCQKP
ncbi:hypothetical protein BKA64DRAFT_574129, partial [Cadophora sp. MPI-SDFR-AT-0126]